MDEAATGRRLIHGQLGVAAPQFAQERVGAVAAEGPGIVLGRLDVELVEAGDRGVVALEDRVVEFAGAVLATEEDAEGVFGIVSTRE